MMVVTPFRFGRDLILRRAQDEVPSTQRPSVEVPHIELVEI